MCIMLGLTNIVMSSETASHLSFIATETERIFKLFHILVVSPLFLRTKCFGDIPAGYPLQWSGRRIHVGYEKFVIFD